MSWFQSNNKARAATSKPRARSEDLIVEEVDGEVLIYDQRNNEAHCLSAAAAQVWRACDGTASGTDLASQLTLDKDTVERALEELSACDLLDSPPVAGITRRQATAKFAKLGAVGASVPLILSIVGPIPEAAATLVAQCQAVNNAVGGHDCGSQVANPVGCHSIVGCCCCHNFTKAPLTVICAGDPQHCCTTATACTAAGGNPCS